MRLVQSKVAEVIGKFGSNDPELIAERLGIAIIEKPMPGRLHGVLCNDPSHGDHTVIFLNSSLPRELRRAALAHELGHYFLHPNVTLSMLVSNRITYSRWEHQADEFAACLLVNMDRLPEGMSLWEIADELGVPESLVRLRFGQQ